MSKRSHRGGTYQSRNPLAVHSPLRSMPLFRTVESVFGPSQRVKVEAELRIAADAVTSATESYARACASLGAANRRGAHCRRWFQAEAMRAINAVRARLRAAQSRLRAAEEAVSALTPDDDVVRLWRPETAPVAPVASPIAQPVHGTA